MKKSLLLIATLFTCTIFCTAIFVQAPANDDCTGATVITTVPFGSSCSSSVSATTLNATQSLPGLSCTATENNDDIWYKFTAASSSVIIRFGAVTNNATGGGATAGYALYEAPCPATSTSIFCSNLGSAGAGYKIFDGLTIGRDYYLRFWSSLTGTNTISFDFCVQDVPAPPLNDECSNAVVITPQPFGTNCTSLISATTTGSTQSLPNPSCAGGFNNDDIWYSFVAATNGVRIKFSNARQAVSAGNANLGYSLYENNCPSTSTAFSCNNNIGGGSGDALIAGLTPGNTYYLSLYSFGVNNYMTFDFCLISETIVANDECNSAITLTVTNGFCIAPTRGDLFNATASAGFGPPACAPLSGSEDVWFKATVPVTGNLIVQTSAVNTNINELIMEAYSGTCGALSLVTCDDDGNPEPAPSAFHPRITLTGRTAGEVIYYRVLGKGSINNGPFVICAWDETATILPPVAAGGNCITGVAKVIDNTQGNIYMWVPFFDNSGNIISEVYSNGNNLGAVTPDVFVNSSGTVRNLNGKFYLDRNIALNAAMNGSASVRLYFKQTEFAALQAADATITGTGSLRILRTADACQSTLNSNAVALNQQMNAGYGNDYRIEFFTPSFSSFYIAGLSGPLPLKFLSFTAVKQNNANQLQWVVVKDDLIKQLEAERSVNGIQFTTIAVQQQKDFVKEVHGEQTYRFADNSYPPGTVLYRIKLSDVNGDVLYSNIVRLAGAGVKSLVTVFPNPVKDQLLINMNGPSANRYQLSLYNSSGVLIKQQIWQLAVNTTVQLQMYHLPAGVYLLQAKNVFTNEKEYIKVVKQ